ncbi:hypothetical protein THTE_1762 [Thermogutta terrifontis]|uniref:Uncharacterized protein n=2 Tax=Thermogutta terrifontis TaxID=1331910 RepID=A0A286REG8_9BACT|nr:hypothetical protein THTE_1762 [Thermogutta terrifontis]
MVIRIPLGGWGWHMLNAPESYDYLLCLALAGDPEYWTDYLNLLRVASKSLTSIIEILERQRQPTEADKLQLATLEVSTRRNYDKITNAFRAITWALPHLSEDTKRAAMAFIGSEPARLSPEDIAALYRRVYDEVLAKVAGLQNTQPSGTPAANDDSLMRLVQFFAPGSDIIQPVLKILEGPGTVDEKLHALCDLNDIFAERLSNANLRELARLLRCSHEAIRRSNWYRTYAIPRREARKDKYRDQASRYDMPRTER